MKIAIMTDTNSGITPKIAQDNGIHLLAMPFIVDGKEYTEYGELSYSEFFEYLGAGAEVSTSQPSPGALTDMWDKLLETNDSVIYIPMSSKLSGTCATAKLLAEEYDGKVNVIDNKRISVTLYFSVFEALEMVKNGHTPTEIVDTLEKNAEEQNVYVAVNTLEHLKKGGRITPAGAALGALLGIKPVLQINGGKLDAYKKVRGMRAAEDTMLEAIENDCKTIFAGKKMQIRAAYSGNIEAGKEWQSKVAKHFPDLEIGLDALPISISCHVGSGALGIGIAPIKD